MTNSGGVLGAEVPQLYITFPPSTGEPKIQLAGFDKATLSPSTSHTFTFNVVPRSFSIWDEGASGWKVVPGQYGLAVGASSVDFRLVANIYIS